MILAQDVRGRAVDVHLGQPVAEAGDPGPDPLASGAEALAEPVAHVVGCRRPVRPEVGLDGESTGLVDVGYAGPAGVAVQRLEGRVPVPRRTEAHVPLPGERLQQRAGPVAEGEAEMPEPRPCRDRSTQLVPGDRPAGERVPDRLAQRGPVGRGQVVVALPAGQLPHPAGRSEREVGAAVLGRQQVGGAAERERLDDPALGQGARDLAGPGSLPPGADRQLGRGVGLRRHRAQPADDPGHGLGADRVEQVPTHAPGQRLGPADRHRRRLARPTDKSGR